MCWVIWLAHDLGDHLFIPALKVPVPSCQCFVSLCAGFHRPTRVVPPASSSGSRTASYGSSSQAQLFRPRPFLLPGQQHWPHKQGQSNHNLVSLYTCIMFIAQICAGLQDLYRQPAYCLPLSDVYSLSEKYRRYKPQYYQL